MTIANGDIRTRDLKDFSARAWINGVPVALTDLPSRTLTLLQAQATCQLRLRDIPPIDSSKSVIVDLSLGYKTIRFFTGSSSQVSFEAASVSRQLNADQSVDFDRAVDSEITWSGRSFVDAVQDILTAAGIPASMVDSIYNPGSGYSLGSVEAITIEADDTVSSVWNDLMDYGGTTLMVLPTGRVRVVNNIRIPAATSQTTYAEGAGVTEFILYNASFSIEPRKSLIKKFTATGPKLEGGAIPNGTYTASGITGVNDSRQYRFLQTNEQAQVIAEREVQRRAREQKELSFEAPLNPLLYPGDTIMFRSSLIGIYEKEPAYVQEVATDGNAGMRVQVALNASKVLGYASSVVPPIADFSITIDYQMIVLSGTMQMGYIVQCIDQSHDTQGYAIDGWQWEATGDYESLERTDQMVSFLFTSLTGASVTLDVDSESGQSATVTRAISTPTTQTMSRVVTVAAGSDGWRVLDSTFGWRIYDRSGGECTAVPTFNESGPLLAGYSDGKIFGSLNYLASSPKEVAALSGSISCLFVNENFLFDVLAGHGSTLSRSQDGGVTWNDIWSGSNEVLDCQSSPDRADEIRFVAGNVEYLSYNGGETWEEVITGAEATTAMMIATAPWGHAVVFDNTISLVDVLRFEEGGTVNWSGIAEIDRPTSGLKSVTALLNRPGWIVGETNDLIRDGLLPSICFTAGEGRLYLIEQNGENWTASLMTAEGPGSGAGKVMNEGVSSYQIDPPVLGINAAQIGYGPIVDRVYDVMCLVATGEYFTTHSPGTSPTPGGVWYMDFNENWSLKNSGLPSGWKWGAIIVNNRDMNNWVVFGVEVGIVFASDYHIRSTPGLQSVVWKTSNRGDSWEEVLIYESQISGTITGYEMAVQAMVNSSGRDKFDVYQDPAAEVSESPGPGEDFPARMAIAVFSDGNTVRTGQIGVSYSFSAPGEGP